MKNLFILVLSYSIQAAQFHSISPEPRAQVWVEYIGGLLLVWLMAFLGMLKNLTVFQILIIVFGGFILCSIFILYKNRKNRVGGNINVMK